MAEETTETAGGRQSPLHERHRELGAKFAGFGGWEMPQEYPSGVVAEHTAVREALGLFDVSHLGKVLVRGDGAADFVNATLSNDLGKISPGKAQYTLCCDEQTGGIIDDMVIYYSGDDRVLLVPNAANTAEVLRRLEADKPAGVDLLDRHEKFAVLAVQGAYSDELLQAVGLPTGHAFMSFARAEYAGSDVVVCRSGYTGERGYELIVENDTAGQLWDDLREKGGPLGLTPCGLGARDTLRTEMGYPLHGQDLTADITPVQARLGWVVGWKKDAFWGKEVLEAEKERGPARRLWGIVATGRGIPRPGMTVTAGEDDASGEVTSGTFSPTLKKGVGLALLPGSVEEGAAVSVDVRGRSEVFTVVRPPLVDLEAARG